MALFIAVAGGTAFAANQMLPKNSVGSKQLKKEAVTGSKIKNGTITGSKLALSSVGTVPSAAHAATAGTAETATSATTAATASNSNSLGGVPAGGYQAKTMWALVAKDGSAILAQSGGISIEHHVDGGYYLHFPAVVAGKAIQVTPSVSLSGNEAVVSASPCGGTSFTGAELLACLSGTNTTSDAFVVTKEASTQTDAGFYITVLP